MKAYLDKNRKGFTLIEIMVSITLLTASMIIMTTIMVSMLKMWRDGSSGTSACSNTSLAMRKLILNTEEGKTAVMLNTFTDTDGTVYGNRLRVTFPYYNTTTGLYDKAQNGNVTTYYLSGRAGTESTGTYLWKSVGSTRTMLSENIAAVRFKVNTNATNLVYIQLKGKDPENGVVNPNYLEQSVKLRNS